MTALLLTGAVLSGCSREDGPAGRPPRPTPPQRASAEHIAASPQLLGAAVFSAVGDEAATPGSKNVRLDEKATLYVVLTAKGGGREALYAAPGGGVRCATGRVAVKPWDERAWGPLSVRWYKVYTAADDYSNWEGDAFCWATLEYVEEPVPAWDDRWSVAADVRTKWSDASANVGTARFRAEVSQWDETGLQQQVASSGKEATDQYGITSGVHRVSIRADDSFCGWLKAFYGLPYIWGSDGPTAATHQTERFVGCDCADFMIAAWRRCGHSAVAYTWTTGLRNYTTTLHEDLSLGRDGRYHPAAAPSKDIVIGPGGVRAGDMLLFSRHVGALSRDLGPEGRPNGVLDRHDLMIHALFKAPAEEPIAEAYSGTFDVVRWR